MTRHDEAWLDDLDMSRLDSDRVIYDLDGWGETPVKTFAASVLYVDGEVTEEDARVAAGIRERAWRARGYKETI